jgi:hypothetical protein
MMKYFLIAALTLVTPLTISEAFAQSDMTADHTETHDAVQTDAAGNTAETHDAVDQHSSSNDSINGSEDVPTGAVRTDEVHTTNTGRTVKDTNE